MIDTAQNLKEYKKRLNRALDNKFLRNTLGTFAAAYKEGRLRALGDLDLPELRREIAQGKDAALPHLEELYEAFKAQAEAAGVKVHLADTAHEANEIIAAIAREHGVHKIVKSKSMTAEETFLNHHLENEGFEVVETDLGEWIIQLRHEGPSHMVMPAIHLSRQEVAELFTKVTGETQEADIGTLVKVARRELRKAFLTADMGISGANFAIAETGTLGIISNEGNARLVTTLPRVHVALVGLDKLVPDLHSALRILKVLPPSATGQVITSYVTWITGATECRAAPDGKKEMHIVFLDNGRLALSRDPVFSQALRCIRCGACANVCPIYSPGGRPQLRPRLHRGHRPDPHLLLPRPGQCPGHRPELPQLPGLQGGLPRRHRSAPPHQGGLRRDYPGQEGQKPLKNRLLRRVLKDRRLFHFLLRRAFLAQKPWAQEGYLIRHLPFFFGEEQDFRSLPAIARIPFRDRFAGLWPPRGQSPLPGGPLRRLPGGFRLPGTGRGPVKTPPGPPGPGGISPGADLLRPARQDDGGDGNRPRGGQPEPGGPGPGGLRLYPDPVRLLRFPSEGDLSPTPGRGAGLGRQGPAVCR